MFTRSSRFSSKCLTALLPAWLLVCTAGAAVVFSDDFAAGNLRSAGSLPDFWTVLQPPDNLESGATKKDGRLHLVAANHAFTSVALASPRTETFGFFARPLTVTLDDILLGFKNLPENEARFRISLSSARTTAELSGAVITLRVRSGLLLMGYRVDGYKLSSPPETLSGQGVNSVVVMPLKGVPSKISLTLGPGVRDGVVRYEITVVDHGVRAENDGVIPLAIAQWGGADAAALIVDARRDSASAAPDSFAELSVGRITVTR